MKILIGIRVRIQGGDADTSRFEGMSGTGEGGCYLSQCLDSEYRTPGFVLFHYISVLSNLCTNPLGWVEASQED